MVLLSISILTLLAFFNYRLCGKRLLYPAVVFCGIWAFDLFLLWFSGDFFYPLLPETLFIFVCGAVMFSLGCGIVMLVPNRKVLPKPAHHETSNRIITMLLGVVVLSLPLFYRWLSSIAADHPGLPFLMAVRMRTLELSGKSAALTLFGGLPEFTVIIAVVAYWESKRYPKRAILAIVLALVMALLVGQKDGPLSLLVALLGVDWIKNRRLRWKMVAVMVLVMLVAASVLFYYVTFAGNSVHAEVGPLLHQFAMYACGGMVGFDRVVRQPNIVPEISAFQLWYLRINRRLGSRGDVPVVPEFVNNGPHTGGNNIYTMYWSYYLDGGYLGAILIAGVFGLLTTLVYKRALQANPTYVLLFAFLLPCIIFSSFNDYLFLAMFSMFKVWVIAWLVYSFPARWAQFKRVIGGTVETELVKSQ